LQAPGRHENREARGEGTDQGRDPGADDPQPHHPVASHPVADPRREGQEGAEEHRVPGEQQGAAGLVDPEVARHRGDGGDDDGGVENVDDLNGAEGRGTTSGGGRRDLVGDLHR
jgi:hypothetical protein